jgi:cysteine synthase A
MISKSGISEKIIQTKAARERFQPPPTSIKSVLEIIVIHCHRSTLMARFANILGTVGNTPVVKITRLAPPDVNLYVKIEAFNPLGSVKDRLALGIIEEAERTGELKAGQTVIEATSGNTGIGLAMVCAQKGCPLVVTMAETFSVERRKLMRFLGAKVVLAPAACAAWAVNKAMEPKQRMAGS